MLLCEGHEKSLTLSVHQAKALGMSTQSSDQALTDHAKIGLAAFVALFEAEQISST